MEGGGEQERSREGETPELFGTKCLEHGCVNLNSNLCLGLFCVRASGKLGGEGVQACLGGGLVEVGDRDCLFCNDLNGAVIVDGDGA